MSLQVGSRQRVERRVVRQLDVGSVIRVSVAISLTLGAIFVVGSIALYMLGSASGALAGLEVFIGGYILGWEDFQLRFMAVLPILLSMAAAFSVVMTASLAIFAVIYNTLADIVGGVEMVVRER